VDSSVLASSSKTPKVIDDINPKSMIQVTEILVFID